MILRRAIASVLAGGVAASVGTMPSLAHAAVPGAAAAQVASLHVAARADAAGTESEADTAAAIPLSPRSQLRVTPPAKTRRFALVVGSNATIDDDLAPLRFADDDAARIAETLLEAGVDVELLTTFDRDSQALFPDLVARARRPSPEALDRAWEQLVQRMAEAKAEGASAVELLIYYSGHGDVGPDGQGYLTLEEGKLPRRDLFRRFLSKSVADHNHILIDACKSEQFVLTRGKTWKKDRAPEDYGEAVEKYLDKNHLGHFPNTGVVLAHSADQQTHEWERYRGGIFTHQLVSGLRGGADLNGDGRIEYSELGAFVSAANHGVTDPRARLAVVVRPPAADERQPLLVHEGLPDQRLLYFPAGDQHRYTVEDVRGVRVADLRRSGEAPGYLRIPEGDVFVFRESATGATERDEVHVSAATTGPVYAGALSFRRAGHASRGALDQAFRAGLFVTPFGPGYYAGFTARTGMLTVAEPQWHVEVWKEVDGQREKVAEVVTDREPELVVEADEPTPHADLVEQLEETGKVEEDDDDDDDEEFSFDLSNREHWGSVHLGSVITPFRAKDAIPLSPKRVTADQFRGCLDPYAASACSAIRGFDLRWQWFSLKRGSRYPRSMVYFRSGYQAGHATFTGQDEDRDPTSLAYVAVPLFFGANFYLFKNFPVRPYAGLGLGLDIVSIRYQREGLGDLRKRGAQIGFELHAGLEARITNYVALTAGIQQQWSSRTRVDHIPDFSNQGLTFITGVAFGFPFRRGERR